MVSKGSLAYQGSLAGLTEGTARVRVKIDDLARATEVAQKLGWTARQANDDLIVEDVPAREVNRQLAFHGLFAHGLSEDSRRLEEVFLELTEEPHDA